MVHRGIRVVIEIFYKRGEISERNIKLALK